MTAHPGIIEGGCEHNTYIPIDPRPLAIAICRTIAALKQNNLSPSIAFNRLLSAPHWQNPFRRIQHDKDNKETALFTSAAPIDQ